MTEATLNQHAVLPRPADLNYSLRRYFIDAYQSREVSGWETGLRVLDLGGHKFDKRGQFNVFDFPLRTCCMNISRAKRPDVQGDGAALPFADGVFDAVICAELLEHVYDPRAVVREMQRVLKPGGRLLITVPFLVQIHGDPDDYGRYTDSFWRRLLSDSGFDGVDVQSQGQFWAVVLDLARAWLFQMRQQHPRRRVAVRVASWLVARARRRVMVPAQSAAGISAMAKQFTTGFGIRARKRLS